MLSAPVADSVASAALKEGLLLVTAMDNVLRLCPPLVVSRQEIDWAVQVIERVVAASRYTMAPTGK